jgi:signal transduction histidine kinase
MTLRQKLDFRYLAIVAGCMLLLAGLAYHEFVEEPRERKARGIPRMTESNLGEYAEVFLYGMMPIVLGCGWWFMRQTLKPIDTLAINMERIHLDNLREPLPRSHNGDEVDRLTEVFNATTERLDQSFNQVRKFTLHASHELKTPLTVMHLQLETALKESQSWPPEHRKWIAAQLENSQRLSRIVDGLTLLTKADAGLVTLEKKPVRLNQLVQESFGDIVLLAEAYDVQARMLRCEDLVVLGDADRLRQVLFNLTDNALKYNRTGGTVRMALRRAEDAAEIEVTNTGDGISPELQSHMFERFVRGPDTLGKAVEGCGLGLAIVRWIVEAHGGKVYLLSEPGKNTTALVRLPLAPLIQ